MIENLRNVAIVAHVDHGKTTLVDQLLKQSGTWNARAADPERALDTNDLERERGITILSKSTAIQWGRYRINIIDTPGHADFGGEVERVLSMADSVLLLVDAVDGPMPQTRFVTQKAFALGFRPLVVINKIDRPGSSPEWVLNQTFDLFDRLGASDEQLDFPVVYTSALAGHASTDPARPGRDMTALIDAIVEHVTPPQVDPDGPFRMRISSLDYNPYVGVIGVGRVDRGRIRGNSPIVAIDREGRRRSARVLQVLGFHGLERREIPAAEAGDIVAVSGVDRLGVSDTLCDPAHPDPMAALTVDEPTISMTFRVNTSPFAGREGRFLTSRQLAERLFREASHNVALRVTETDDPEAFHVAGRGELHLAVLIETMRREGYELAVSRPEVVLRDIDGDIQEPYEQLVVELDETHQGPVMERLGARRGELIDMQPDGKGRVRMDFHIPARGLIGFQTEFRTLTAGSGVMFHRFERYGPRVPGAIGARREGVLVSMANGKALAYALFNLQERGRLFIGPGDEVYEGQIIGSNARQRSRRQSAERQKAQ